MDWGIVLLLVVSVPFIVWGFWVYDKGETKNSGRTREGTTD